MDKISLEDLFDRRLTFPDFSAQKRFGRLVGLDGEKARLTKILSVLIDRTSLRAWGSKHHPNADGLMDFVERRPPLVLLAGDVGTGKTELAETVGDGVARQLSLEVTLFPLSLATRGSGRVGEMTKLIAAAFHEAASHAQKMKRTNGRAAGGVILLIDEADALAQSRETSQMHHEDRAGVNAFIRGVDRLAEEQLPAAVMMCTNRLSAIDPAVQRRAADVMYFSRPNAVQRRSVLEMPLVQIGFSPAQIGRIVERTGVNGKRPYGFTYSDLTQRFLPALVLDAYPADKITFARAEAILDQLEPTPPFREGGK